MWRLQGMLPHSANGFYYKDFIQLIILLQIYIYLVQIVTTTRDVKLALFRNRSLNFYNRLLTDDRIDSRQSWHTVRWCWVVSVQCSVWLSCDIYHYRYLFCLIDWLTDVCQAGDVRAFGTWQLWMICDVINSVVCLAHPQARPTRPCHLNAWVITCHPTSASRLVRCTRANYWHTVYDVSVLGWFFGRVSSDAVCRNRWSTDVCEKVTVSSCVWTVTDASTVASRSALQSACRETVSNIVYLLCFVLQMPLLYYACARPHWPAEALCSRVVCSFIC